MLVLGAEVCAASFGAVGGVLESGGGGGVAEVLSVDRGANLLAMALAFAF